MKSIILFIANLFSSTKKQTAEEQRQKIWETKYLFRIFFEGYDDVDDPIIPIIIDTFQITDFTVDFKEKENVVNITLGRPGILIGKGGNVIGSLTKYLTEHLQKPTRIHITESKLWKR